MIKQFFFATALLVSAVLPAKAWDLEKMNEQIEKTNVIVSEICSGTIIEWKGKNYILTANHCITDNLREIEKTVVDQDTGEVKRVRVQEKTPMFIETWKYQDFDIVHREQFSAEIVRYDVKTDVAILEVTDKTWKPEMVAPMASDGYEYKRGKKVFAVGNPGIAYDNSVTEGIISAPERSFDLGTGNKVPFFQHSAGIIGGSSGGAIYNDSGELIGTVSAGVRGSVIGLAVPISKTKELLKRLGS